MKKVVIIATVAVLGASTALAEPLDLRTIACGDFAKTDTGSKTTIVVWLNGYYMGNNDEAIIDFDKLNKLGDVLIKYCSDNPTVKLSDAAEKIMGRK